MKNWIRDITEKKKKEERATRFPRVLTRLKYA